MTDATHFEVQVLNRDGETRGQWQCVAGAHQAQRAMSKQNAILRRDELRRAYPDTAFRAVPFGTGPNSRPGDVVIDGRDRFNIVTELPGVHTACGPVRVTAEQADNASIYGWVNTSAAPCNGMVWVERS